MGLDYTTSCVNFRDVGTFLNLIAGETRFLEGQLFRGGSIDHVKNHDEISKVKTLINLRNKPDSEDFEGDYHHFPMANKVEKYDTRQKEVRVWLNQVMDAFENPELRTPVLIHCLSGKDRTGIVIAAILLVLGVDKSLIKEEYLLSDGEVNIEWIEMAMDGMEDPDTYFNRVSLDMVRSQLKSLLLPK